MTPRRTIWQRALAVIVEGDEWANVLLDGSETQTISARAYAAEIAGTRFGQLRPVIDALIFWQPHHCQTTYEAWRAGASTPEP